MFTQTACDTIWAISAFLRVRNLQLLNHRPLYSLQEPRDSFLEPSDHPHVESPAPRTTLLNIEKILSHLSC